MEREPREAKFDEYDKPASVYAASSLIGIIAFGAWMASQAVLYGATVLVLLGWHLDIEIGTRLFAALVLVANICLNDVFPHRVIGSR